MKRKFFSLIVLLSLVMVFTGCVVIEMGSNGLTEYKEYDEKIFGSFKYVSLDNSNGSVAIEPSTDGKITVQYEKRLQGASEERLREVAPDVVIQIKEDGATLRIATILPFPRPAGVNSMGVSYRLYLPVETFAHINTSNGMIETKGMRQDIDLESSNGKIHVRDHVGNIVARTSNAKIEIANTDGMIKANTSNGGIELTDITGAIDAGTSNGKITVNSKREIAWADLDTSNAAVEFLGVLNPDGECKISTSNGAINFWVDRNYGYDLLASTSNGRIRFELPIEFTGIQENTHVNGKLFGGGIDVSLRTTNGYITVRELEAK